MFAFVDRHLTLQRLAMVVTVCLFHIKTEQDPLHWCFSTVFLLSLESTGTDRRLFLTSNMLFYYYLQIPETESRDYTACINPLQAGKQSPLTCFF